MGCKNYICVATESRDSIFLKLDKHFFGLKKDLFIGFVYIIPSNSTYTASFVNSPDGMEQLGNLICKYNIHGDLLIMGDMNARTARRPDFMVNDNIDIGSNDFYEIDQIETGRCNQDTTVNPQGRRLLEICQSNKVRILNGRTLGDLDGLFTFHGEKGSSSIDVAIMKEESMDIVNMFEVHNFLGHLSDHCMISTHIRSCTNRMVRGDALGATDRTGKSKAPLSYKWHPEIDSLRYSAQLKSKTVQVQIENLVQNLHLRTCSDVITNLTDILQGAANVSLTKRRRCKARKRKAYKNWFNRDCESARKLVKKLASKLRQNPFDGQVRQNFFKHKKIYKKLIKRSKKLYKQQCVDQLENMVSSNPKDYWKLLNNMKNEEKKNQGEVEYIPLDAWFNHFKQLSRSHEDDPDLDQKLKNEEVLPHFSDLDYRISEDEVRAAVKKLKSNKAAGHDSITGDMIKAGQEILVPLLTKIFNYIFSSKEYPDEWNRGIITPIHKKGSKFDPNNYRGITVNSTVAKVYSMVLCNRLEQFVENHSIMKETQIGFKKNSQTVDHVMVLQALTEKYMGKGEKLHACFIDYKKAYDSVWRKGLLYKLLKQNIRGLLYHQIKSMYDDVSMCVKQNGYVSDFFRSDRGVKQGDVLSPILFNLFINDVNDQFDDSCVPVSLNNRKLSCLLYADDLIILSESKEGMENCLERLNKFCSKWKLEINIDKSKAMVLNQRGSKPKGSLRIGNAHLDYVTSYTYLGMEISSNGAFTSCKQTLAAKGKKAMNRLKSVISGTNIKKSLALKMFDQLVLPVLMYGGEVWGARDLRKLLDLTSPITLEDTYEKLPQEKINIHFSKYILGVSSKSTNIAAMAELGRYPLAIKVITQMIKYYAKILSMGSGTLLNDAFEEMTNNKNNANGSWLREISNVVDILGLDIEYMKFYINKSTYMKNKITNYIRSRLETRFRESWGQKMKSQVGKLEMFSKIKTKFAYEAYLDEIRCNEKQRALTKLRISNHRLEIEVGRYKRPYIERGDRICNLCNMEMGDEFHFMFRCPNLGEIRKEMLGKVRFEGDKLVLTRLYLSDFLEAPAVTVASFVRAATEIRAEILNETT